MIREQLLKDMHQGYEMIIAICIIGAASGLIVFVSIFIVGLRSWWRRK